MAAAAAEPRPAEVAPTPAPALAPVQQHVPRAAGVGFGVAPSSVPTPSAAAPSWPPCKSVAAETTQASPLTAPAPAQPTATSPSAAAAMAATAPTGPAAAAAEEAPPLSVSSPPPTRTSPVALSLSTVGALPFHFLFTPPSPAGRSSSASPTSHSSFRSSPVAAVRPPLLPPAVALSGGRDRDRDRDLAPSEQPGAGGGGGGFPLAWSLSASTLSCGSRSTGGRGGGMSSVSASVCSDAASPLVGMRFVVGEGGAGGAAAIAVSTGASAAGASAAGASKEKLRPKSWTDHGRGVPVIGVRGAVPLLPVALCGVGRSMQGETEAGAAAAVAPVRACRAPATLPVPGAGARAAAVPAAGVGEELSFEGGVGGRRGKRPRRYFFP